MKLDRRKLLFLLASAVIVAACSNSEAEMHEKPDSDITMLSKFIVLDPRPISAEWSILEEEGDSGLGPIDSVLVALLRYSSADFGTVETSLSAGERPEGGLMRKVPDWLPKEVATASSPAPGEAIDFGGKAASANLYALAPYSEGFAVAFAASNSVLVYLYSK
jgi:hypothetical protein